LRAKARLDTLGLYDEPVRLRGVRLWHAPWFFRIPGYRRYHGYAFRKTILVRSATPSDDLVTHELCHIWQSQRRPLHHFWTWLTTSYPENPYELEARDAVSRTRDAFLAASEAVKRP
jgi:hypothetical protein